MSERGQRVLVWWGIAFLVIWGLSLWVLLDMLPPPTPKLTTEEIGRWYSHNHDKVRIGAVVSSWTGGWMVPFAVVIAIQIARLEIGRVWSALRCREGS